MESGIGIINIRSLFGVEAIREKKKIELVLELMEWDITGVRPLGFEEENFPFWTSNFLC